MSATAAILTERRFTLAELHAIVRLDIKDRAYLTTTRLGPAVQEFLAWKRLSRAAERTLDQYERDLRRLCLAVPDKGLGDVDTNDLAMLLGLCPEPSWSRFRAAWNGMFRWAQLFDKRPDNPCDRLPPLRRLNAAPVYNVFTLAEQKALISGCKKSLLPGLDRARLLVLLATGARKEEASALQFKHIDLPRRAIRLYGKGRKERIVAVSDKVIYAIEGVLLGLPTLGRPLGEDDHLFFPWRTAWVKSTESSRLVKVFPERPMSKRGFHEWWERRIADAGIAYRKLHMTRHTFATNLLDADANLYDVRDLLGHESTRTTEVYIHSSAERLRRATDKLEAYRRALDEDEDDED